MPEVLCKPVETRSEKKQFLHLPWKLYRDDPHWIPPLRVNQKELVGYSHHPFYDDGESQTFLAYQDGQPCGRIAAIVNHAHNQRFGDQIGFFGFFESIDDQAVADALFDAARDWLVERGMITMRGPMNPSLHYEIGLLVDGFDSPPMFMTTYNPPYYQPLVENYGFTTAQNLFSYWGHISYLDNKQDKKVKVIADQAAERFNVKTRRLDKSNFDKDVRLFLDIYNRAMVNHWGFVPMTKSELDHLVGTLKYLIVPEITSIAEVDGRPVGAVFGLLDYNPRIKTSDGRLFPFGLFRLLWNRRGIKKIRILAAEVLPEFQKWGLSLILLDRLVPDIREWGIDEAEFSWIAEDNKMSWKTIERGGGERIKTHRIYDRALE